VHADRDWWLVRAGGENLSPLGDAAEALAAVEAVRLSVGTVGQFDDLLPMIDDVQPVRDGRGMMATIVRTTIRQQERGGRLPNTALQADDHLARCAPSVARR
jgi:hypothetical protein